MNSCDRRFRDERDIRELLEITAIAFARNMLKAQGVTSEKLRARYEALIARRKAEDAGKPV